MNRSIAVRTDLFIAAALLAILLPMPRVWSALRVPKTTRYDFEADAVGRPPAGFTSYATGGGPAGKWIVREMAEARVTQPPPVE